MDYLTALKRPFTNWKNFGIGALLSIVPIVNIITFGYIYEIISLTLKNKYSMPDWTNLKQLFINGFLLLIIIIIYFLPLIVISVILTIPVFTGTTYASQLGAFGTQVFTIILLFGLLGYFIPPLLINFVQKGKFSGAFDFSKLRITFTGKYLSAWLVASLITVVISSILNLISRFLAIEYILNPITSFITMIIGFTILTQAVKS